MLTVEQSSNNHTVIVTVDAAPSVLDEMENHARTGLEAFPEYPGFVSGALHRSADGARLVQYLQWSDEAAYLACRDDPRWDKTNSADRFMAHVTAGRATIDERSFAVRRVVGAI